MHCLNDYLKMGLFIILLENVSVHKVFEKIVVLVVSRGKGGGSQRADFCSHSSVFQVTSSIIFSLDAASVVSYR